MALASSNPVVSRSVYLMKLVSRCKDYGWQEQIEEDLIVETELFFNVFVFRQLKHQACGHACEYRENSLMYSLDFLVL